MPISDFAMRLFNKLAVSAVLICTSLPSFAISNYINAQSEGELSSFAFTLVIACGVLLLSLLVFVALAVYRKNKLEKSENHHQTTLEKLPSGIVHVGIGGNIIYVNKAAATLLGRDAAKLVNSQFSSGFTAEAEQEVKDALTKKNVSVQVRAKSSNLFLLAQIGPLINHDDHAYTLITLSNQTALKRDFDDVSQKHRHLNHLVDTSQFARVHLNLKDDRFVHEHLFNQYLNIGDSMQEDGYSSPLPVSDFVKYIHSHDLSNWNDALDTASSIGKARISIRMEIVNAGESNLLYMPLDIDIICTDFDGSAVVETSTPEQSVNTLTAKSTELQLQDKAPEAPKRPKASKFTLLLRPELPLEQIKKKLDIVSEERDAMINAIPHPAYSLDKTGKIVWSNSRFDMLLRSILPEIPSKNLLELNPFPEKVMKLHQNISFMSSHQDGMEFSVTTIDNATLHFKLELAFYVSDDRLNEQKHAGMVGVLKDLTDLRLTRQTLKEEEEHSKAQASKLAETQAHVDQLNAQLQEELSSAERLNDELIATQNRAEQTAIQLHQEKERMGRFLELAPVAIATINDNDEIISANKVMLDRLKYTEKELKKGNIYKLFSDPTEAGTAAKYLNKEGKLRDFHVRLVGKDEKIYPGELKVDLFNAEKQEYLFWIVDRSDEQFQRDKFENTLTHSRLPMAILTTGGFTKLNKAACTYFGVEDEEDMFGRSPITPELNESPEVASHLHKELLKLPNSGKVLSMPWAHKVNGKMRPCHATFVPIYKDQVFNCILCIWQDREELRKKELELKTALEAKTKLENEQQTTANELISNREQLDKLSQEHASLKEQLEQSTQAIKNLTERKEALESDTKEAKQAFDDAQASIQQYEKRIAELEEAGNTHQERDKELCEQLEQARTDVSLKEKELSDLHKQLKTLNNDLVKRQQTLDSLTENANKQLSERGELEQEQVEIQQKLEQANSEIAAKAEEASKLEQALKDLESTSDKTIATLKAQHEATLSKAKTDIDAILSAKEGLQQELKKAEGKISDLEKAIEKRANHEKALSEKLRAQETSMTELAKEKNQGSSIIEKAQGKQKALAEELTSVRRDRDSNEQLLKKQKAEQEALVNKLEALESQLAKSQEALAAKSEALKSAERSLKKSNEQLSKVNKKSNAQPAAKEQSAVQAANIDESKPKAETTQAKRSDIASIPLPNNPEIWFDISHFLKEQGPAVSVNDALAGLTKNIEQNIEQTERAIATNKNDDIQISANDLVKLGEKTHSEALMQLIQNIEHDCAKGMFDNVSIRWPATKSGLQKTLRVVYSHLNA
ncbi:PAS domain S-box protein [Glaciecola siphonariae]|uniref:PAS domain S-box protein n=1 Tax=Glaciecola siphonariae TaxID=521012 RepID=A0ABV9LRX4_9ALTE